MGGIMKRKFFFLALVLSSVFALADQPNRPVDIGFYAEEVLRIRKEMEGADYTSVEILKKRIARLTVYPEDQEGVAPSFGLCSRWGAIDPSSSLHPPFSGKRELQGYVVIPDTQVNQENYTSSFNQNNPSSSMFPDRVFITVWEDERNGDLDIFAQKNSFDGVPLGYNLEVGKENLPRDQYLPCVSIIDDTSFVVIWVDEEGFDIYGRRFTKNFSPLGETFLVDDSPIPYTTWSPALSPYPDGKFVVVWADTRAGNNIYVRRFDREGNPLGASFKVNDDDGERLHASPRVSVGFSGNFVVVWEDFRNTDGDIYLQRFDSSGTKLGENILVNLDSLNEDQYAPSVSMGIDERFLVAWVDLRHGDEAIFARLFSFAQPLADTVLFSVSPDTGSVTQENPQVVSDTLGRFTITWTDYSPSAPAIYAQRFDSTGGAEGGRINISDLQSTGERHSLSLSASPSGSFVVTWMDKQAGNYDIYAQTVTSNGFLQGSNFVLNDDQLGANQNLPKIATRTDGGFVVVWEDWRRGTSDIFMKRFDRNALVLSEDRMVNDSTGFLYRGKPELACAPEGHFMVVWEDARENLLHIYAQLFDSSGSPVGENFKVNCANQTNNSTPDCDVSARGNFVVVWCSREGSAKNIYGRLFSSSGEPLDTCFKVNDDTLDVDHLSPRVSMDSSGAFVVAWQDRREGQDRIYLQRFSPDGTRIGSNFPVYSENPTNPQYNVDLDLNQKGDFVIAWTESYAGSTQIILQRYDSSGTAIGGNIEVVDDPSASPDAPKIKLTDDGYFVVEWTDHRSQGTDIYFQTFLNGVPQGPNQRVNTDPGNALQDSPDMDLWNLYLYSVWRDNRIPGLGFSIFFNVLNYRETKVEDHQQEKNLPTGFSLSQNYPNPFNSTTRIQYTIEGGRKKSHVYPVHTTLRIYNILGQLVRTLVDQRRSTGRYEILWDGKDDKGAELSSGVYFYQLKVDGHTITRKMLLLK